MNRIAEALVERASLKFGHRYDCKYCGRPWFLDGDSKMMHRVPDSRRPILEEWATKDTRPSDEQKAQLAEIGSAALKARNYDSEIAVPCRLRSGDEEWDPAIVMITRVPPVAEYYSNVRLLAPDDEIHASGYALSLKIRKACLRAQELRMGFAPTAIEDGNSHRVILNWGAHVYRSGTRKGEDYHLAKRQFSFKDDGGQMAPCESAYLTYVYADWYEQAPKLRKA